MVLTRSTIILIEFSKTAQPRIKIISLMMKVSFEDEKFVYDNFKNGPFCSASEIEQFRLETKWHCYLNIPFKVPTSYACKQTWICPLGCRKVILNFVHEINFSDQFRHFI